MWCYSVLFLVGLAVGWSGLVSCYLICPDGTVCLNDNTCCVTSSGYGCCPYPQAVCCSDLVHCCPNGFDCHTGTQTCTREGNPLLRVPMRQKVFPGQPGGSLSTLLLSRLQGQQAVPGQEGAEGPGGRQVDCGEEDDGTCPSGTECCRGEDGGWLCCTVSTEIGEPLSPRGSPVHLATKTGNRIIKLREGQCCSDGVHCCEYGYTCDSSNLRCRKVFTDVPQE